MIKNNLIQKMSLVFTLTALVASSCSGGNWREEFNISERNLTHTGKSKYFILEPGFQLILESETKHLTITVLDETKEINGIGTRVVEERELKNGELFEVSRNFFAIDHETGDVFYFGEDVDYYKDGKIVNHAGAWLAYENGARPGMLMPGNPELGMKFYQELSPGKAMDRAEVISISETYKTPAGEFRNCLITHESSKMKPKKIEEKVFAPGIGLLNDGKMRLISYGYIKDE